MQFHQNELFLYYDPQIRTGKQSLAYAKSISNNINEVNWNTTQLTTTLWKEIINMLKVDPQKLLNKAHVNYQSQIEGKSFTMTGWMEVLVHNPEMLNGPIAIYNGSAIFCENPTDILRLDANSKTSAKVPPHLLKREES
jgi:arsenate reductase